jgi:hypothetical protein
MKNHCFNANDNQAETKVHISAGSDWRVPNLSVLLISSGG